MFAHEVRVRGEGVGMYGGRQSELLGEAEVYVAGGGEVDVDG
jgi:hypothetical protein